MVSRVSSTAVECRGSAEQSLAWEKFPGGDEGSCLDNKRVGSEAQAWEARRERGGVGCERRVRHKQECQ